MTFRGIPKLNSVRLGTSNRIYAALPMPGTYAASGSTGEYYPWVFSRSPLGGEGHYLWRKVKQLGFAGSVTITDDDPASFGSITISLSGTLNRNFGAGGGGIYNDERDTEYPTFHSWSGAFTSGSDSVTVMVRYCGVAGENADGAPANTPGPSFYVTNGDLIPQFWVSAVFSRSGAAFGSIPVRSYLFTNNSASFSGGSGSIDGQGFDLQIEQPYVHAAGPPEYSYTISAPSIALTVNTEYGWV